MPRLDGDMESHTIGGKGKFEFTGLRLDRLGATGYTLVTIAVDVTGSVEGFEAELLKALRASVDACKKSPNSDSILVRVIYFSNKFRGTKGVMEVHGFKPLADIDVAKYPPLDPGGMTPLCDAVYSAIGATNDYGQKLKDNEFGVNGIVIVITDGGDNESIATMAMVKKEQRDSIAGEKLESSISVLVGINTGGMSAELQKFQQDAGMTQYLDVGNATPQRLAKLAAFVSKSVSSQSQALGTGGPSQQIAATI